MKLSTGRVVHGYETQLEVYRDATERCDATFLIINVGSMGRKLQTIRKLQRSRTEADERASTIEVVDATRKRSASKRK